MAAKELLDRRIDRRECAASLAEFVKRGWHVLEPGAQLKWGWALDAMCAHLEAVTDGRISRLLINVPPGMMKSLLVSVFWPAWEWGPRGLAHKRFLSTSHEENLAIRDSDKCRELIKSRWFQNRWPIKFRQAQDGKRDFGNERMGVRQARPFTSMTGARGDTVILDDPISVNGARSPAKLQEVAETFTESLPTRLNDPQTSAIVVIMQRLHERDPSGLILEHDLGYEKLILPMEHEIERVCETSIGFRDPRKEDGDLLFADRFPRDVVERDKKALMAESGHYAVAGQFQQRPVPRGGGLFKREDFNIIPAEPPGVTWVRGWDLAATAKDTAAYTAGVRMGRTNDGRFIIADVRRGQLSPAKVLTLIINTAAADANVVRTNGGSIRGSLPKDPGQAGKAQVEDMIKRLAGHRYTASPETGAKETRAQPLAAQVEIGNVDLVDGPWVKAFLDEVELFPMGKFMDQVDAASRAFSELVQDTGHARVFL